MTYVILILSAFILGFCLEAKPVDVRKSRKRKTKL